MEFETFKTRLREHMDALAAEQELFVVDVDRDKLWELYLSSFAPEDNPIFRERTQHDCSACRQFIKTAGAIVGVQGHVRTSVWDISIPGTAYTPVVKALSSYVKSHPICDVFLSEVSQIGIDRNYELGESGSVHVWEHLHFKAPSKFLHRGRGTRESALGARRALQAVFARSLQSISVEATQTILELISQGSLYRGEEWREPLRAFLGHQMTYAQLQTPEYRHNYTWEQSARVGEVVGKIRNHSIGTLLINIAEGEDLDTAVRKYEAIVAPSNYRRPKPIYTPVMLKRAEQTVRELGYMDSLARRHAQLGDITVNNVLFADRDVTRKMSGGNPFETMAESIPLAAKRFERVDEIPIEAFIEHTLPQAQHIKVLLENRHAGNLVSLVAPANREAPSMFKWDNGFSWAYAGNVADSMKARVKALGGDVTGVLRFSIQWNEQGDNEDDLDAHCIEPGGNEIYYNNQGCRHRSSGVLDVDVIVPKRDTTDGVAVENITWAELGRMPRGVYKLFVHCFSSRGAKSGFSAEVEFDGQTYSFSYDKPLRHREKISVAEVTKNEEGLSIQGRLPAQAASKKLWGLDSQRMHPVSVLMRSPNYWDGQTGIGNRHYFFMLEGCQNPETPNGFFNEYLRAKLNEHRRVFEALGSRMQVEPSESQLSGLGFSSTQRNTLIVEVEGQVRRNLKVII